MERETGFEPATSTLARSHSTTELFPLARKPKVPHAPAQLQPRRALPVVFFTEGLHFRGAKDLRCFLR